ncbi:hypothetical protein QZH41_012977, partial [Actinostola sp. cb2023]
MTTISIHHIGGRSLKRKIMTVPQLYIRSCSINFLFVVLFLPPLASIAENFNIYRAGYQGNNYDSFQTPGLVCGTSTSCHDYYAQQTTCNCCSCPSFNDTFGYLKDAWRCFGKSELRQQEGKGLTLHFLPPPPSVQRDAQAARVFEGRIMKLNFECKKSGFPTWKECFLFKESYESQPVTCPSSFTTINPSRTTSPKISHPPLPETTSFIGATEELVISQLKSSTIETSLASNSTSYNPASKGARVHKNVIIGVSAAGGALLVVIVTIICIVCCRRRHRNDITKYTAALYDSTQDQCSAGIYAETSIRLPSSASVCIQNTRVLDIHFRFTGHSNPSYERGPDPKITISASRTGPSPSQPQPKPPRFVFTNDEGAIVVDAPPKPRPSVKQRGNMLVKYENVTVLADLRPESVPDAEIFYDNPGGHSPQYHVLENPQEIPSYGAPSGPHMEVKSPTDFSQSSFEESTNQTSSGSFSNDVTEPEEPIYINSPINVSGDARNDAFPFEVPQDELDSNALSLKSIDYDDSGADENKEIYANYDAMRGSYSNDNPAYDRNDDDDHDGIPIDEPIYDNQSIINKSDGHTNT